MKNSRTNLKIKNIHYHTFQMLFFKSRTNLGNEYFSLETFRLNYFCRLYGFRTKPQKIYSLFQTGKLCGKFFEISVVWVYGFLTLKLIYHSRELLVTSSWLNLDSHLNGEQWIEIVFPGIGFTGSWPWGRSTCICCMA